MLQACVVSVYNQPVPESLERYEIVFLEANVGSDSTGILEPSVKSTTNSSSASALCNIILVAMGGGEGSSGHKESVTFDETT